MAVMGKCELDFRRAEIDHDEVIVTAIALMGAAEIIVPEGIDVELIGAPIMGAEHMRLADVPTLPGSPRIVVRAVPIMGDVTVRSKPQRRDDQVAANADNHRDWRDLPGAREEQWAQPGARPSRRARRESRAHGRELERRYRAGEAIDLDDIYDVLFARLARGAPGSRSPRRRRRKCRRPTHRMWPAIPASGICPGPSMEP